MASKTPVVRCQVLPLLLLPTSSRGRTEQRLSNGVCAGEQHSPLHCWAVTVSFGGGLLTARQKTRFFEPIKPYRSCWLYRPTFLSIHSSAGEEPIKDLVDSISSEKVAEDRILPAGRYNPRTVLPENILCSFKVQGNKIFSWSYRISPDDSHTTGH